MSAESNHVLLCECLKDTFFMKCFFFLTFVRVAKEVEILQFIV